MKMPSKTPNQEIPIIDLSAIARNQYDEVDIAALDKVAVQFGKAMSGVGFAYLVNHGIDMNKVEHIYELAKEFFLLPNNIKGKYRKFDTNKTWHGYTGPGDEMLNEKAKNSTELRETWDTWGNEANDPSKFPSEIPGFKTAFDNIRKDCNDLGKKLLRCMGKFLNLEDEEFFVKHHRCLDDPSIWTHTQFRTIHYYSMDPEDKTIPPNAIRCGEHTDWGSITLLFQDMIGGLEVRRSDGTWIDAVPIKDAIILNSGQLMELWSSGMFPATPHRVRIMDSNRIRNSARQSLIYFINPDGSTDVKPVVPIPPGKEDFRNRGPMNAHHQYHRLMVDSTTKTY